MSGTQVTPATGTQRRSVPAKRGKVTASGNGAPAKALDCLQVLGTNGALLHADKAPMSDGAVLEALKLMMLSRASDARLISLQRQGRMGTFSAVIGQEAAVVGSSLAIDPSRDWLVPAYREMPAMIRHGYPLENFIMYWNGNAAGGRIPDGVRMLPVQIALAAQIPHAVGLAWGRRLQYFDEVALVYFGDGASSEGDFHEALNLAGVTAAPVVFILQNNGWAISTPRSKQSAASNLACRAEGYGFPGVVADGNDLFAVYQVTCDAVARARRGDGPTLIELITYRVGAHNTADDPTRYRQESEVGLWAEADPIARVTRYLEQRGAWTDAISAATRSDIEAALDRAINVAESAPPSVAEGLFKEVYADPPIRVQRQRTAAMKPEGDR